MYDILITLNRIRYILNFAQVLEAAEFDNRVQVRAYREGPPRYKAFTGYVRERGNKFVLQLAKATPDLLDPRNDSRSCSRTRHRRYPQSIDSSRLGLEFEAERDSFSLACVMRTVLFQVCGKALVIRSFFLWEHRIGKESTQK